jgi:hypothetical protein
LPVYIEIDEGGSITLSVVCRSNPKFLYKWFKNGIEIDQSNKHLKFSQKGDTYNLEIPESVASDFGYYTFAAKLRDIVAQTTCYVDVIHNKRKIFIRSLRFFFLTCFYYQANDENEIEFLKPSLIQKLKPKLEVFENERIFLETTAIAAPVPNVRFKFYFKSTNLILIILISRFLGFSIIQP